MTQSKKTLVAVVSLAFVLSACSGHRPKPVVSPSQTTPVPVVSLPVGTTSASPTQLASPSAAPSRTSQSPTPSPVVVTSSSVAVSPSAHASASSPASYPNTGYALPGSVGYLGSASALTVYQPGGAAPSGCSWQSYGLRCGQTDLDLDHVWLKGSLYWTGEGHLTISNSIVQGGTGSAWYAILGHPAVSTALSSVIEVTDSTVGWLPGQSVPSGIDVAPIWAVYGNQALVVERDDISGMPQGVDPTGGSLIEDNYIHGLVQNGTASTPTHLDGIYSQGGSNILIQGNYVDVPVRSDTTAALFIQDRGSTDTGISIKNNYLNGGAYVLRNQTGVSVTVENNVFGQSLYGYVGDLTGYPGTYGLWSGNLNISSTPVPKP